MNSYGKPHRKIKIALALVALLIVCAIACTLTACSLFNDYVKGVVGISSDKEEQSEQTPGSTDNDNGTNDDENQEGDVVIHHGGDDEGDQGGNAGGDQGGDQGSDQGGEQGGEVEPIETELVTITTSLVYDKASNGDLTIAATHPGMDYEYLMGMGLVNYEFISGRGVFAKVNESDTHVQQISVKKGSSEIKVDGEYLSTLPAGEYDFYYCVSDDDSEKHYAPFKLTIKDTKANPVGKIDYDIDCPNVYVTFTCDCGGDHTVSFDGDGEITVPAGGDRRYIGPVDKTLKHTAIVTCSTSGRSSTLTKNKPNNTAISGGFLTSTYTYMGRTADRYLGSDAEATELLRYLAYTGAKCNLETCVTTAMHAEIKEDAGAYLQKVQEGMVTPWSLSFSISYSEGDDPTVTFMVTKTMAENGISSSGYTDDRTLVDTSSHAEALNVRDPSGSLPIDAKTGVSVRNSKELLAVVAAGNKPLATGDTLTLYNKAREICYTYLTDEMTDVEKLHVIYDYLASKITYDYSALHAYELYGTLCRKESLSEMKEAITDKFNDESCDFSTSMRVAIATVRDSAENVNKLLEGYYAYIQSLSAFTVEGVLYDKLAVCEGISYAFMLLARIEGIECDQITGNAIGDSGYAVSHAWNKVCLDGIWYCVDATWGNTFISDNKYVTHRYFLVDEASFASSHVETIGSDDAVEHLAIGNIEYYASVVTAAAHLLIPARTLNVCSSEDLRAAVNYYKELGNYYEIRLDPASDLDAGDVSEMIRVCTGKSGTLHYHFSDSILIGVYQS